MTVPALSFSSETHTTHHTVQSIRMDKKELFLKFNDKLTPKMERLDERPVKR